MKKSKMPWIGIAGLAAGILCGTIVLRFGTSRSVEEHPSLPGASKRERHDRPERVGKSRDAEQRVFFHNLVTGLPPSQQAKIRSRMAPLLRELAELGIGENAYYDLAVLAAAEAARDRPETTFKYLLGQGDPAQHEHFTGLLHEWLQQDPAAAEAAVAGLPPGEAKLFLERTLFQEVLSIDPDKALELLKASKNPQAPDYYYAFLSLSKRGVESAIRRAGEITDESLRAAAIEGVAETYAKEQPEKAWEWALSIKGGAHLMAASTALTELLKKSPTAAIQKLDDLQSREVRGKIVGRTIEAVANQDPQAAYRLVNGSLSGYGRYVALSGITGADLEGDRLPQIKEMVGNEPAGKYRDNLVAGFVQNWAQTDPDATYKWLQETGDIRSIPEELREQLSRGEKSTGNKESGIRFK